MASLGRILLGALPGALLVSSFFACGGPSERHCAAEAPWSGTCHLKSVLKVRQIEFPTPHGVYEVIYEPEANPASPNYTPPALREEIKVISSQELELEAYFQKNQRAPCRMAAPAPGSCEPGKMAIDLPTFQATGATPANEIRGCAQIESQATQDQLPALSKNATQMPEVVSFADRSAEASAEANQVLGQVAQKLKATPGIECVAIVGQVSPGEPANVANDRARTVRDALIRAGVEPARLTTITVTEAVFGGGTEAPPPDPTKRRVTLRVLLQR